MAESDEHVRLGGVPYKADPEQAGQALEAGGKLISREEAQSGSDAIRDLSYVDQNWGTAGKLGLGLASGLSLGLAPGMLGLDPGLVQAAQTSGAYTAGDVAGTLLPALLSGGESLVGRSALSRALSLTPAGILETAGTGTERLVGKLLGEEIGTLGRLAATPARMAARGMVEGAAINLGHTVGDSLIQNKPLAAEALLASGADGALFGGLIGGSLGTVGALAGQAVDSLAALGKSAVGRSGVREGLIAKRLGQGTEEVQAISKEYGGYKPYVKELGEVLDKGGVKIGASEQKLSAGVVNARKAYEAERTALVSELDKHAAHISPSVERIHARIDAEVLAPRVGTFSEAEATKLTQAVKENLQALTPLQELQPVKVPTKKIPASTDGPIHLRTPERIEPGYEIMGMSVPTGDVPSWQKWIQSRDQVAKSLGSSELKKEVLNVIDSELRSAMEAAQAGSEALEGLADKYAATTARMRIAESLEETLGKRAAGKILTSEPAITPRDAGTFVGMAAIGHPLSGVTWLAAKGAGKKLQHRIEPAMAQMAFDMSIGAKASDATNQVRSRIGSVVKNFFKTTAKSPSKSSYTVKAERSERGKPKREQVDRRKYEELASRTEQLLSANHQDKVRRYAENLYNLGYQDFALALMATNNRAVQYLMWNMPARQGTKGLNSLRPMPASKVPTLQEYKFLRIQKAVTNPLSVLDDMESGQLSRDAVMAMKYVYPELHTELVVNATEQIAEMKAAGDYLPMSKITMLGLALDAPVDSTQTSEYIGAVQVALNAPPANVDQPQAPQIDQSVMNYSQDLLTPLQKVQTNV